MSEQSPQSDCRPECLERLRFEMQIVHLADALIRISQMPYPASLHEAQRTAAQALAEWKAMRQ